MVGVVSANERAGFAMQIRVAAHAPKPGRAEKKGRHPSSGWYLLGTTQPCTIPCRMHSQNSACSWGRGGLISRENACQTSTIAPSGLGGRCQPRKPSEGALDSRHCVQISRSPDERCGSRVTEKAGNCDSLGTSGGVRSVLVPCFRALI